MREELRNAGVSEKPAMDPAQYELIEACVLSGQVHAAALAQMMRDDPIFAEWLKLRARARQGEPVTDDCADACGVERRGDWGAALKEYSARRLPERQGSPPLRKVQGWALILFGIVVLAVVLRGC